jgi:hypothetical protein
MINWTNVTDFGQIPQLANTATGGGFWTTSLFLIWVVLILILSVFGFEVGLLVSSFLALIIGTLLAYGGLVSWTYVMVFIGVILFMILYIIYNTTKSKNYNLQ